MTDIKTEQVISGDVDTAALIRRLDQLEATLNILGGKINDVLAAINHAHYEDSPVVLDAVLYPWDVDKVNGDTYFQVVITGVGEELSFEIYSNQAGEVKRLELAEDVYNLVLDKIAMESDVVIGKMFAVELMTGGVNEAS